MNESINLPESTPTTTIKFSMDFLCKLIPREFTGNRYEIGQFLADCNNANDLACGEQKIPLLYFILAKISGRAKEQLAQQQFTDWASLKCKLKDLYQDKKHYSQVMEELNNCKQYPRESVNDFFQRIEMLNSRALSAVKLHTQDLAVLQGKIQTINEISLNRFIFHSLPGISQMLRWKDFKDLNSAFTAAVAEERALNIHHPSKSKFCSNCKRNNHSTFECRFKNTNFQQKKSIHLLKNETSNSNVPKSCKYCKKPGHSISECRKLKYKKQMIEQNTASASASSTKNQESSVHLNYQQSAVTNTTLSDQISQLTVFEN